MIYVYVVYMIVIGLLIWFCKPIDMTEMNTNVNTDENIKEVNEYSDDELEEALELHNYILKTGTVPLKSVANVGTFSLAILVGYILGYVLYIPIVGILLILNIGVKGAPLYDVEGGALMGVFILILDLVIVFLAIYGLGKMFDINFGIDKNKDELFKDYAKRMQAIIVKQKEEYDKSVKAELVDLQTRLGQQQIAYDLLAKNYAKLQVQMKDSAETFKREKKLWALEKKELQYQIKLKQGLVDELDEADSPLGGLYN